MRFSNRAPSIRVRPTLIMSGMDSNHVIEVEHTETGDKKFISSAPHSVERYAKAGWKPTGEAPAKTEDTSDAPPPEDPPADDPPEESESKKGTKSKK